MVFFAELFESKMKSKSITIITLLVLTISVRPSISEQSLEAVKEVSTLLHNSIGGYFIDIF